MKLLGKHVVITGASSGIGEQLAYAVAKRGGVPILLARNEEALRRIAEDIERTYRIPCHYFRLDVSDLEAVKTVFQRIFDRVATIDVLVNNAGFGVFEPVVDLDLKEMEKMFAVNVFGLVACTKMVLPHMIERKTGHIINVASQAGKIATPKSSIYAATKHAVLGFTNSLRMEVKRENIFVTAVNPGPIATNFFQIADRSGTYVRNIQKMMLRPEAVAEKIADAMLTPVREINMPRWMNAASVFYQLFPRFVETIAGDAFYKK
ncbi:SDR family NAD(P)-dependent oxidoreductase [Thermolongibacillus altinsuensis]